MEHLQLYNALKNEVREYVEEIKQVPKFREYYKYTHILYSGLPLNPKFMFIGINPGIGKPKNEDSFEKQAKLEYFYKNFEYPLALNTRKLFKLAGCGQHLENAVKSNCFFFATANEKKLYQMISHIKHLGVYKKADDWTLRLINLVGPEIIICEGNSAFERVTRLMRCEKHWDNNVGYAKCGNIHIIGYKRTFSHIRKAEDVAQKIKSVLAGAL